MQRTGIIRNLWSLEGVGENVIIIHVHMAFPCLAKKISLPARLDSQGVFYAM